MKVDPDGKVISAINNIITILQNSEKTHLAAVSNKLIQKGRQIGLNHPCINVYLIDHNLINDPNITIRITIETASPKRGGDSQEDQLVGLIEDVASEIQYSNRRLSSDWILVSSASGTTDWDEKDKRLTRSDIDLVYEWGGDYEG